MANKNWDRRELLRAISSQGPKIWFKLARVLLVLVLASFPLACNSFSSAKYTAKASGDAGARVAKWDVKLKTEEDVPFVEEINGLPDNGSDGDHPLLLFFKGLNKNSSDATRGDAVAGPAALVVTFANNSEVAACYIPKAWAEKGTPIVEFYKTRTAKASPASGYDYSDRILTTGANAGVTLAPGEELQVFVVIKNSTFTYLKIGADCIQVD